MGGVHDVAEEIERAVPAQQRGARVGRRAGVEKHSGERRRRGQGPLPAKVRQLHQQPAQQRAGDAQDGNNQRVAVRDVRAAVAELRAADSLQVGEESIVEAASRVSRWSLGEACEAYG